MVSLATTSGSKAQNAAWFGTAVAPQVEYVPAAIHFAIDTAATVQYTIDNGANWVNFREGTAIPANSGFEFSMSVIMSDRINLRHTNATPVTVIFCRVTQ